MMDTTGCVHVHVQAPPIRKGKKKQAKDEVDRLKQAEKKKRRLEKALATSAAIRSELEKKKQKKKEEQERLDEEGAAIAEAVAMHVLLEEEEDDSSYDSWNRNASNINLLKVGSTMYSLDGMGLGLGCNWGSWGPPSYFDDRTGEISAGIIAAQAVSSLQIAEDSHGCPDSILINRMLRS